MKRSFFTMLSARRNRAFTLAEVIVALGIVASVVVAIVAAMSPAIKSIRASTNLTTMGRIAQEVISNIQMSDWADIDRNFKGKELKYDNDGFLYEAREGQDPTYEARVILDTEAIKTKEITYRTDFLRKMIVEVEYTPGGQKVLREEVRKENIKTFYFLVGNQNKAGRNR